MTDPPDTHPTPAVPTTPIRISYLSAIADSEAVPGTSEEANESDIAANVTIRQRSRKRRAVPPLPEDATVITPPRKQSKNGTNEDASSPPTSPHRPAPSIRIETRETRSKSAKASTKLPDVTMDPGTRVERSDAHGKRGGTHQAPLAQDEFPPRADRQDSLPAPVVTADAPVRKPADKATGRKRDSAKKDKYVELEHAAEKAQTFDALAGTFAEMVTTMKLYKAAPTKELLSLLDCIQDRLTNHHAFPREDETHESFSTVLSRSVSSPVASLTVQVDAQQRAIQSLTKTPHLPHPRNANHPPLPNPSDERILVRFHGAVPPILSLPYPEILSRINARLTELHLPALMYTQKHSDTGIFIVPATKAALQTLSDKWNDWAPSVLPGGSIAPVATHCFLQVDGIPFAGAGTLDELRREFEERNPQLGRVVGMPTWVNKPPSEARAAAIAASGRKPPRAGSLFIRLENRGMVDKAVAGQRVILAGTAPAVGRGFPHLRVVQCWGCLKFGHTRARCSVTEPRCAGCGQDSHGVVCSEKPCCVNCGGAHRADNFICPSRKRVAEHLRARAADLCEMLDAQSPFTMLPPISATLSPLSSSVNLANFSSPPPAHSPLAPRLPERF
ncbi:hypothetical protein GGX14DRAFT_562049 [Mycena pura]|uniref:Gag-like protein n=1 Tax=Mycena pura TaxID=153505 RepID=A0AAD6YGW4_9AGAR|nr:hypothetical protein GGX14DRAFT_562049 [Mycena pura]